MQKSAPIGQRRRHPSATFFYQYLGAHSFLIGLLPFFLPVFLWTNGLGISDLCLLIGVSGLSFTAALPIWQHLAKRWPLRRLVGLTFYLEFSLVFVVGILTQIPGLGLYDISGETHHQSQWPVIASAAVIGVFNGAYNAFFWTTQRTLFLTLLGNNDTGKQYGNFQIFVTVFLKVGILLAGLLLDYGMFVWLLALSAGVGTLSYSLLASSPNTRQALLADADRVSLRQSLAFRDTRGSRSTFSIDGVFLYLESHFWTLSLFLVVKQDFSTLGVAVVLLAIGFALLFFLMKNRIDHLPIGNVYTVAVLLYSIAWLLRFTLSDQSEGADLLVALMVITFFSTFFRLAFNKRFFDVARQEGAVQYLLLKSYHSQWILGWVFVTFAFILYSFEPAAQNTLQYSYLVSAVLALGYLRYKDSNGEERTPVDKSVDNAVG